MQEGFIQVFMHYFILAPESSDCFKLVVLFIIIY